ncbi:Guanosine-diphosphatase [Lachancea thermotolerans]
MAGLGSLVRNYRFLIAMLSAVMMILLLRSSASTAGISEQVSTKIGQTDIDDVYKTQPIKQEPGYLEDESIKKADKKLEDAVKQSQQNPEYSTGTKCTEEHQYVVMIDAGSTGSRVHIYEFDMCTKPPTLLHETFEMLKPGLSSYGSDPAGAAQSLDKLLDLAVEVIPEKRRKCSPVAVKATAGLRKLGDEKSAKILEAVRAHLEKDYPFPVVENGAVVMTGDEEGVYAWITANYLLGNIAGGEKVPTAATFDLGGGSTQIVFEPAFPPNEKMIEGEHKYPLQFGDEKYTLYQFSHLGYGLMEGRNKVNSLLVENAIKDKKISKDDKVAKLFSPCLPPGAIAEDVEVEMPDKTSKTVTFEGPVTPAGPQCRALAEKVLHKDAKCSEPPCSFNGVHQPSLVRTFKESNDLYVFSYFYDKTQPLGLPSSFTLQELADLARMVCNGESVWESVFSGIPGSIEKLEKEPQWCLDLSFQVALLHTGYDIPLYRELKTAEKISDYELGWCLGASLPLLEGKDWKCKIEQT